MKYLTRQAIVSAIILICLSISGLRIQAAETDHQATATGQVVEKPGHSKSPPAQALPDKPPAKPSETRHSIQLNGKTLRYTARAGKLPIMEESGKIKAEIFFVSYSLDDPEDKTKKPITFAFNGGPGASSLWLHMGALGPKRVPIAGGRELVPPYSLVENEYSWLEFTDLVFIDPVGTGYSRPGPKIEAREFYRVQEDVKSMGEFIRLYVTKYERWLSPKFIAGESYGTTRAAGLSRYLQDHAGMNLNGLILISPALSFDTFTFVKGNDLPFVLYLPPYTMAAQYHGKLSARLEKDIRETRTEVERFASGEYLLALSKGNRLTSPERDRILEKLMEFTGLSRTYLENSNLRIDRDSFLKELLRDQNLKIGVMDSRVAGRYRRDSYMESPDIFQTVGPLTAAWNEYVRKELHYETDTPYILLSMKANQAWNWGSAEQGYLNVLPSLEQAMMENSFLKVFLAGGYYDLDISYFATQYTADRIDRNLRGNVTVQFYEGGHQMYVEPDVLKKLTSDVSQFINQTLSVKQGQ